MGQWGRGMPRFFPQKKSPVGVLHQHRSPLGRLNVKNEEIDEMIKEAPGPINFTVFLTMFGEKLKGERVPREPGAGSHSNDLSHLALSVPQFPHPFTPRTQL